MYTYVVSKREGHELCANSDVRTAKVIRDAGRIYCGFFVIIACVLCICVLLFTHRNAASNKQNDKQSNK